MMVVVVVVMFCRRMDTILTVETGQVVCWVNLKMIASSVDRRASWGRVNCRLSDGTMAPWGRAARGEENTGTVRASTTSTATTRSSMRNYIPASAHKEVMHSGCCMHIPPIPLYILIQRP